MTPDERKVQKILDEWDLNRLEQARALNDMEAWKDGDSGGLAWNPRVGWNPKRRKKETR